MSKELLIWTSNYKEGFCVISSLKGFKEQWLLLKGISLASKWPDDVTFSMSTRYPKDIKLWDNLFGDSYCVISSRAKEAVSALVGKSNIEFLPVSILNHKGRVASGDYFIMNPLDVIDCIDQEKSGVDWNAIDPTKISSVEQLVIKEDVIPKGIGIFRAKFLTDVVMIKPEIAAKLSAEGLAGLFFIEQSEYTG